MSEFEAIPNILDFPALPRSRGTSKDEVNSSIAL